MLGIDMKVVIWLECEVCLSHVRWVVEVDLEQCTGEAEMDEQQCTCTWSPGYHEDQREHAVDEAFDLLDQRLKEIDEMQNSKGRRWH